MCEHGRQRSRCKECGGANNLHNLNKANANIDKNFTYVNIDTTGVALLLISIKEF